MDSTLKTWKHLQENDYFENHRLYKEMKSEIPPYVMAGDISGKIVVEIGGGYGRHTAHLASFAEKVYMIEVSTIILDKASRFLKKFNIENVELVLAEEYKGRIPKMIDYVYEYLVFQHLTPKQTIDYLDFMYDRLGNDGKANYQFRLGKEKALPENKEPTVMYAFEEIEDMLRDYEILDMKQSKQHLFVLCGK